MRAPVSGGVDEALWRSHVRIGTWFSLATCAAQLLYYALTPQGPGRPLLAGIAGLAALGSLPLFVLPLRRILHHSHGMLFFYAWTGALCALLTLGVILDSGIVSPLLFLFFLPLIYAAMAYPPAGVAVAGVGVAAGLLIVAGVGVTVPSGHLVMVASGFVLLAGMCALQARGLRAAYARQRLLTRRVEAARSDDLTGCLTHRAFHEDATALRDGSAPVALSLILLDLDEFRVVNEGHGHPVGDAVLARVGGAIRAAIREGDVAGRVGGDEFAVLLPGTGAQDALQLAEGLQRALRALSLPLPVTASLGVATVDGPAELRALLEQADEAVYTAKHRGRDRLAVFHADTDEVLPRAQLSGAERTLHRRVRALLAPDAPTPVFQPICSLHDGSNLGYEALTRIPNSHLGPDRWLDLAGGVGLRPELEAAMWRAALGAGSPPEGACLFLNASPEVLLTGVLDAHRARLAELGAVIEVSEGARGQRLRAAAAGPRRVAGGRRHHRRGRHGCGARKPAPRPAAHAPVPEAGPLDRRGDPAPPGAAGPRRHVAGLRGVPRQRGDRRGHRGRGGGEHAARPGRDLGAGLPAGSPRARLGRGGAPRCGAAGELIPSATPGAQAERGVDGEDAEQADAERASA